MPSATRIASVAAPAAAPVVSAPIPLPADPSRPSAPVYWRVEGSLLELTTVRPIAFFTWNSQTFIARAVRRSLVLLMAVLRPFLYAPNRAAATRIVHAMRGGDTPDRIRLRVGGRFRTQLESRSTAQRMMAPRPCGAT